jgi:hypothetical protein
MLKVIFSVLLIVTLLISCSTTKEMKKEEVKQSNEKRIVIDTFEVIDFSKKIYSLKCSGEIEIADSRQSMSGAFELKIIRNNKLIIDIFGPFGINVGRIYATKDSLFVYNLWESKYFQSEGALEGFEFLTPFATKLFNLLIAEPFLAQDSLKKVLPISDSLGFNQKISDSNSYRFIYRRNYESMTYLNYNFNKSEFEVYFRKFEKYINYHLPVKIDIYDQKNKNQIKLTIDKFESINHVENFIHEHKVKFKRVNKLFELF